MIRGEIWLKGRKTSCGRLREAEPIGGRRESTLDRKIGGATSSLSENLAIQQVKKGRVALSQIKGVEMTLRVRGVKEMVTRTEKKTLELGVRKGIGMDATSKETTTEEEFTMLQECGGGRKKSVRRVGNAVGPSLAGSERRDSRLPGVQKGEVETSPLSGGKDVH